MKKITKILASSLVAAMILSMAACGKAEETTKKKKKTKKTTKETTEETTEEPTETTEAPTESTTEESTTVTTQPSGVDPDTITLDYNFPEAGCAIELAKKEDCFYYKMDMELNPDDRTIGGHIEFTFFNYSEDEWDKLCMRDYSSLFIDAKTAGYDQALDTNGALTDITNIVDTRSNTTLEYTRDTDVSVVWIPLTENLKPGDSMTLTYDFKATIPTVADRYGVDSDVFNVTNFYPILAVYDKGDWSHAAFYDCGECFFSYVSYYDVNLTVPKDWPVLSTGTQTAKFDSGDKSTYTFDAPSVRDFVFCTCKDFKFFEDDYNGVHIRVVYNEKHPGSSEMDAASEASLQAAKDSLDSLGYAFGKYPYPELDIILAPIAAGGMEYPNLIIVTDMAYYTTANSYEDIPYEQLGIVVAHEIGHQWFMGIVGSNSGMEPWLDESFASYTEIVYEHYLGLTDEYAYYTRDMNDLTAPNMVQSLKAGDEIPVNRPYYDFSTQEAYISAAYSIGKVALYQMEEILGRENFYAIIREYVHRNAFTNSTEDRLFEAIYDCAGKDNADLNKLIETVFER